MESPRKILDQPLTVFDPGHGALGRLLLKISANVTAVMILAHNEITGLLVKFDALKVNPQSIPSKFLLVNSPVSDVFPESLLATPQAGDQLLEQSSAAHGHFNSGVQIIVIDPEFEPAGHLHQVLNQACELLKTVHIKHFPNLTTAQPHVQTPTPAILLIFPLPPENPHNLLKQLEHFSADIPFVLIGPPEHESLSLELQPPGLEDYWIQETLCPKMISRRIRHIHTRYSKEQAWRAKLAREYLITQITQQIHAFLDLESILEITVQEIRQVLAVDRVAIYQFRPDYSGVMVSESVLAPWPSILGDVIHDHCFSNNFVERYQKGRVQAFGNIQTVKLDNCHRELLEYYNVQANLVVPIVVAGKLWGLILSHQCSQPRVWANEHISLVQQLSGQLAIAIHQAEQYSQLHTQLQQQKQTIQQLRHQAQYDALTQLPNREFLGLHLQEVIKRATTQANYCYAVLCLDLDRFKTFNDSLGHSVGDIFLQELAQRLRRAVSPHDFVARLGGDEFVIVLDQLRDQAQAETIAQYLLDRLTSPFKVDQYHLHVTATIGLVMGTPNYQKPEELIRDADTAMYRAKDLGKNCYEVFNPQFYVEINQRLNLELEMWQAVEQGDFTLVYQPIFNLHNQKLVGLETLIRWPHSRKGIISPEDFIPIAEETGLIIPLGTWVLQTATQQFHLWQQYYPELFTADVTLSINLSSRQFSQANLVTQICKILEANKIPHSCLKIEITESLLMEHSQSAQEMLNELKGLGSQIVIDDFGTGYSSLSYLSRLPLDCIKIDRSFITQMEQTPEDLEVVHAIISLARILKLDVVAEGIETDRQLTTLKKLGCPHGQGYWYSRPLSPELVPDFIRQRAQI